MLSMRCGANRLEHAMVQPSRPITQAIVRIQADGKFQSHHAFISQITQIENARIAKCLCA